MANTIIQPYLNPIKFSPISPVVIPQYISKFLDDWRYHEIIKDWQEPSLFFQEWVVDDSIRLQFITNYSPLTLKLYTCDGDLVISTPFDTLLQDYFRPGYYIRQVDFDLSGKVTLGEKYYLTIECGSPVGLTLISEPFKISDGSDTLLLEYYHYERYGDVIFDTPFEPSIRIPAILEYKEPGDKSTVFEDQPLNLEIVQSTPFDVFELMVGGQYGVSPWFIRKLKWILGCSDVKIDGRYFSRSSESKWQKVQQENVPVHGWKIDLREKLNRSSIVYENDVEVIGLNSMMAVIDTKGFGINDESGNDFLEIEDVN